MFFKKRSEVGTIRFRDQCLILFCFFNLQINLIFSRYSVMSEKTNSQSEARKFFVHPMREQRNTKKSVILRKIHKCPQWISRSNDYI